VIIALNDDKIGSSKAMDKATAARLSFWRVSTCAMRG